MWLGEEHAIVQSECASVQAYNVGKKKKTKQQKMKRTSKTNLGSIYLLHMNIKIKFTYNKVLHMWILHGKIYMCEIHFPVCLGASFHKSKHRTIQITYKFFLLSQNL